MLKHIPVITYACGYILEDWKYFSRDHDSVSLYRREIAACLKDYFSQIYRLEKHSQSCPNMPQNWRRGFSAIARLCQTCTIVTSSNVGWLLCGWEINLLVMLYVQFPENPLRKYISTQDIPDRKKKTTTILRLGFQWEQQDSFLHRPFLCLQCAPWVAALPHVPGAAVGTQPLASVWAEKGLWWFKKWAGWKGAIN